MKFSQSKVEYASHQLSLYHGECPHNCQYCFVKNYTKRKWNWACGDLREASIDPLKLASQASKENVTCLVVSFTNDPLPFSPHPDIMKERLQFLIEILGVLEERQIPTKVLTKNCYIGGLQQLDDGPYNHIQLGCTISSDENNRDVEKYWEPQASPIWSRLDALHSLHKAGFRTWVSMEPILPQTNFESLFDSLKKLNLEEIWLGKSNYISELEKAYDWREVAQISNHFKNLLNLPIHFKKELTHFLHFSDEKPLDKFFIKEGA